MFLSGVLITLNRPTVQVEIPEIEFSIRPRAERRVDTIYNMRLGSIGMLCACQTTCTRLELRIASAVFHLGDHVQKNRRMGGALSEEDALKICDTIDKLNILPPGCIW